MQTTRRDFLHRAAVTGGGIVASTTLGSLLDHSSAGPGIAHAARPQRARVAVVRRSGATRADGTVRDDVVKQMVYRAVCRAVALDSPRDAFAKIFRPDDVVGIKVNCLAGRRMSTQPAVALALAKGLRLAGLAPSNIVIWERSSRELERAGYAVQRAATEVRVYGTDGAYETTPTDAGSVGGCLTRIVTRTCTAQINAPVLKDHDLAGVSLGLKNYYGAIHNPNKYHDDQCSPYAADLSAKSVLGKVTRLVVVDALFAQCHGGPAHSSAFVWRYDGVLASTDPVAVDAVGARIIEAERKRRGLPSLAEAGRPPRWLERADRLGLGQSRAEAIEVVKS